MAMVPGGLPHDRQAGCGLGGDKTLLFLPAVGLMKRTPTWSPLTRMSSHLR
jgi:hypothetical protein